MHCHFHRLTHVFGLVADVDQEIGELNHTAGQFVGALFVFAAFKQFGPMVLHHAAARAGRHDDRIVFGEQSELGFGDIERFFAVPRRECRLPAAALLHREMHFDALLLQQRDGIHTCFRHKQIQKAGAEKVNIGGLAAVLGGLVGVHDNASYSYLRINKCICHSKSALL